MVLEAPIPLPGVRSPRLPGGPPPGRANLARSNGFEGMAISPDGRTLYPTLEGPLADDADKTIRRMYTFDIAKRRYAGGHRSTAWPTPATSSPTSRRSTRAASSRSSATTSRAPRPCTRRRSWSTRATAR